METAKVKECMSSLKIKSTKGFNRIPQRELVDGGDILVHLFAVLFNKICFEKQ
jgi:hypothetical protein